MAGNIIRLTPAERIAKDSERQFVVDFFERNGQTFIISSGTFDLIQKSTQTKIIDGDALTVLTGDRAVQGTIPVGKTGTLGAYLLKLVLDLGSGEDQIAVQDYYIEDPDELAQILS